MKKLFVVLPVIGALCGCAATTNSNPDKIFLTGQSGTGYIKNISVDETFPTNKELKKLTIQGESYADATVYYSVVWFDKDNMKLNSTLSKSTLEHLRKNQPFIWTAVAPSQKAEDYKIYISDRAI